MFAVLAGPMEDMVPWFAVLGISALISAKASRGSREVFLSCASVLQGSSAETESAIHYPDTPCEHKLLDTIAAHPEVTNRMLLRTAITISGILVYCTC